MDPSEESLAELNLYLRQLEIMKRIHLFEFEDLHWFPNWIREAMTLYIRAFHGWINSASAIAPLVERGLAASQHQQIIDLCSGAGGPMFDVVEQLRSQPGHSDLRLTLTDLFPNQQTIQNLNAKQEGWVRYSPQAVDASNVPDELVGMRTMICSLHHMNPQTATNILKNATDKRQPFLAFEISDNSPPIWLWWVAIPIGFILSLFMTLRIRPLRLTQVLFTYIIPIIPMCVSWDGAVSNARTYTKSDLEQLLSEFESMSYKWEIGTVKRPGDLGPMIYLLGLPN